jgi:FMN reductase
MTDLLRPAPRVTVLCGNPKPGSRTLLVATHLGTALQRLFPGADRRRPTVVDLADHAGQVLAFPRPAVDAALAVVTGSDVLVVATPVYKGSYTGLLKAFLDHLPHGGLGGSVAVPLTVMAAPGHAMAADVHLRPLLVELGAAVPTPSLLLEESRLGDAAEDLDAWVHRHGSLVTAAAGARARQGAPA